MTTKRTSKMRHSPLLSSALSFSCLFEWSPVWHYTIMGHLYDSLHAAHKLEITRGGGSDTLHCLLLLSPPTLLRCSGEPVAAPFVDCCDDFFNVWPAAQTLTIPNYLLRVLIIITVPLISWGHFSCIKDSQIQRSNGHKQRYSVFALCAAFEADALNKTGCFGQFWPPGSVPHLNLVYHVKGAFCNHKIFINPGDKHSQITNDKAWFNVFVLPTGHRK